MPAFWTGDFEYALVCGYSQLRMAFSTLNDAMINELKDFSAVKSNNKLVTDKKCGYSAHISFY
jgi:hypothetical protein